MRTSYPSLPGSSPAFSGVDGAITPLNRQTSPRPLVSDRARLERRHNGFSEGCEGKGSEGSACASRALTARDCAPILPLCLVFRSLSLMPNALSHSLFAQVALEATNDDKWGPHGSQMAELAKGTSNGEQRGLIMALLWRRLAEEKPELWRHVYKTLAIFDYFIANGDISVVEELRDNLHKLKSLSTFEYKDPEGKDQVR